MTEDEMVGWHHRLLGHEFEQVLGLHDGLKSRDTTDKGPSSQDLWFFQ